MPILVWYYLHARIQQDGFGRVNAATHGHASVCITFGDCPGASNFRTAFTAAIGDSNCTRDCYGITSGARANWFCRAAYVYAGSTHSDQSSAGYRYASSLPSAGRSDGSLA